MWALPWVPNQQGEFERNPLSALSRWKILDNLRRSLVPAALMLLLGLSWMIPVWPAFLWVLLVLAIMLLPVVLRVVVEFIKRPADLPWRLHLARRSAVIRSLFGADGLRTGLLTRRGLLQLGRGAADAGED